jgi:hypothetical protein
MPEYTDQAPAPKPEKKDKKLKLSSTKKNDEVSKSSTMLGKTQENPSGKPDIININPVLNTNGFSPENKKIISEIEKIYDKVMEASIDRSDTHKRDEGTTSLKNIYRADTPGQGVNMNFAFKFKNAKNDKEAFSRSGQPRNKMDLVPRMDNNRDRHTDSDFYRQQSIVKKVIEAKNPLKKSPWEKMLDKNPKHAESEKKAQEAKKGLEQNKKDYEAIVNKEETEMNEITHTLIHRYIDRMISKHPETMSPLRAKTKKDKMRAAALQLALDKDYPKSAIHRPHVTATEEVINEIGDTEKGQYRLRYTKLRAAARAGAAASEDITSTKGFKPEVVKKNNKIVAQASKRITPLKMSPSSNFGLEEDATSEKDPLKHLEDRLNKAGDVSHNAVDKIMREVARDFNMDVHDLHNKWVSKYKITPDQYVKEDYQTPVTTGKLASPNHYYAIKDIALNTKNRNLTIKEDKKPWNSPNPNKKHHHLSPAKIAIAKARAKAAGRPYPNLVDNMAVAKESLDDAFLNAIKE